MRLLDFIFLSCFILSPPCQNCIIIDIHSYHLLSIINIVDSWECVSVEFSVQILHLWNQKPLLSPLWFWRFKHLIQKFESYYRYSSHSGELLCASESSGQTEPMVIAIRGGREWLHGVLVTRDGGWDACHPVSSSEQCAVKKKATLLVYRQAS